MRDTATSHTLRRLPEWANQSLVKSSKKRLMYWFGRRSLSMPYIDRMNTLNVVGNKILSLFCVRKEFAVKS